MYSVGQKLPRNNRIGRGGQSKISQSGFSLGYLIIILAFSIFVVRALGIINRYNERGGYAYVQLLNFSMPVVENQVYDKGVFLENNLSIKNVVLETLGIRGINTYNIVGSQISVLSKVLGETKLSSSIEKLTPFSLNDDSIAMLTEEEIVASSAAYDPTLKKILYSSKPEVLIFHTHTTEGYAEAGSDTGDSNVNIVGVGDVVTNELEKGYGISVIHDKTNHSVTYTQSYARSNETLKKYLDQYGDFKIIIDLHRDGIDIAKAKELNRVEELKNVYTTSINNENLAKMMFVTAGNSTRYAANEALVNELYNTTNKLFPGIIRETYHYEYGATAVNYSLSDNFVLIEVGSNANTSEEARTTAKYIARIIAEHINR